MLTNYYALFISLIMLLFFPVQGEAHPHAFIDMKNKVLVENNRLTGFSMQWILDEPSSSAILYDLALAQGDRPALQKLIDDVIKNIVQEHYFSYLFNKKGDKIKYTSTPRNYGMKSSGTQVLYYFDFMLSKPPLLTDDDFELTTYDPTYYVSMYYDEPIKSAVDFSALPPNCTGRVVAPQVDEKMKQYAASLDRNQRDEDASLGEVFAQKVIISCK